MTRSFRNYIDNKKRVIIGVSFALFLGGSTLEAQNNSLYELTNSPTQKEFGQYHLRPNLDMRNRYLQNPALLHRMIEDRRYFFTDNPQAEAYENLPLFVTTEGGLGEHEGDYLPIQGNEFKDLTIRSTGYIHSKNSTFLGKAGFAMGQHHNIGWNTQRYPELYWPYIVADSTGGNVKYEKYNILCSYSTRFNKVDFGFSGEYIGDFAFKQNDPRIENITSWLVLKSGLAYKYKNHLFSLGIEYTLHRQHMDVKHFRSGQFSGFFVEYGFGMYDYIHSPVFNSTKQQNHIHNWGGNLAYHSDPSKPLRMNARIGYNFDRMTTEEYVYKLNLYRAVTHQLDINYGLLWNNKSWGINVFADVNLDRKNGREFLFERYVSSVIDGVDVYDYKKIGQQDRYQLHYTEGKVSGAFSHYLNERYTLSLLAGVHYFSRKETYKEKNYQIKNTLITPSVGLEMGYKGKWLDLDLKANWGRRTSMDPNYRVGLQLEKHTEFQHAFTPYAYYANNANVWTAEITASHRFSFARMGLQAQLFYVRGNRLSDISFDRDQFENNKLRNHRYAIELSPDVHNATWAKLSLFAEF